jgi:hypothetical protein
MAWEHYSVLPTFFVIGASKAGTTSLHEYLAAHPQIAMTTVKEPMCFEKPDWEQRLEAYRDLFPSAAPVRGESSTAYSAFPWVPEIPDRVRAAVPEAKIIYVVRDPIPRTLAHYAQNVRDRFPVRPFAELMDDLEHPMNMPVWASRYATQLERWTARFDQVLVLDAHDLRHDRPRAMRGVLEFLGVDAGFSSPAWKTEHNPTASHRRGLRRVRPPELTADQRERLAALLAPEAQRLRTMTGIAFDGWEL